MKKEDVELITRIVDDNADLVEFFDPGSKKFKEIARKHAIERITRDARIALFMRETFNTGDTK